LWVLKTVEANQPHVTTPTTARTVPPRNVGDLYAIPCTLQPTDIRC
jgi:hypothetical protein